MDKLIDKQNIETLYGTRFLSLYDLKYAEGKHYFVASRKKSEDLVGRMDSKEFQKMLPDAVTVAVVLHLPDEEPRLLLSYEYRYPIGQFLLSPVAGLLDPEDKTASNPLITAAIREIREESGLVVKDTDKVCVLNPCTFCTPGMTDESNAFLCAEITLDSLDGLNQNGAVGSELFDGFILLNRKEAEEIYRSGRCPHGNFYSLATWTVLSIFLSLF